MADLVDPDLPTSSLRPAHHHRSLVLLVVAGGAVGTLLRAVIESAVPRSAGGWPWATFLINISGAFVLGALLEVLTRAGPDSGWRRNLRVTAGTGFLGGYTTYSTFAVEISQLSTFPPHLTGVGYALASVVLGTASAALGLVSARSVYRSRPPGRAT